MSELQDPRRFRGAGEVLAIAWPAALTMLNSTVMRFVDGLMVARVGTDALDAQFAAGILAFVPESFAVGVLTLVNTYVAQNLGAGRTHRCGEYAWAGILLAGVFAALIAPLAIFAAPLFGLIGHPHAIRVLEVMYFRYMVASIFLTLTARSLEQFFFGVHRPRVVLVASLIGNAFNVLANYVLIFGKLGFPAMGLEGAAIGTLVSWALLLAVLAGVFGSRRLHEQYATRNVRSVKLREVRNLLRRGYPPGIQFTSDVLSWGVFSTVIVATFGELHLTASTVAVRWIPLSFMPAVGIGVATTALVGRYIGEGRPDLARRRAHAAVVLAGLYMGACALAFLLLRHPMVAMFVHVPAGEGLSAAEAAFRTSRIIEIGGWIMICAAVFQVFDAVGIVYLGALRGAGDTFWPMVATMLLSWGLTIGGGTAMVHLVPQLGAVGPWMTASAYVVCLGTFLLVRFESGRWRRIDLLSRYPEVPPPAADTMTAALTASPTAETPADVEEHVHRSEKP